jgi:hypothetical protein
VNERDTKGGVVLAALLEDVEGGHSFEATDDEESVDLVLGELGRDASEVGIGEGTVGTELGSTASRPLVDTEPAELGDVAVEETNESIVDGNGSVAVAEATKARKVEGEGGRARSAWACREVFTRLRTHQ